MPSVDDWIIFLIITLICFNFSEETLINMKQKLSLFNLRLFFLYSCTTHLNVLSWLWPLSSYPMIKMSSAIPNTFCKYLNISPILNMSPTSAAPNGILILNNIFSQTITKVRKSIALGGAQTQTSCSPGKHPNHLDHQHHMLLLVFNSPLRAYWSDHQGLWPWLCTVICSHLYLAHLCTCPKTSVHLSKDICRSVCASARWHAINALNNFSDCFIVLIQWNNLRSYLVQCWHSNISVPTKLTNKHVARYIDFLSNLKL